MDTSSQPSEFTIVPNELSVKMWRHSFQMPDRQLDLMSFATFGLTRYGQKEVVFTISVAGQDPANTSLYDDPKKLFLTLHSQAQQGNFVTAGGLTELGSPQMLGHRAVLYQDLLPPSDYILPPGYLCVNLLHDDELSAVKAFGHSRTMSLLGRQTRYFPYPFWVELNRPAVQTQNDLQTSILSSTGRLKILRSYVTIETHNVSDKRILLQLPQNDGQTLASSLAQLVEASAVAILTDIAPTVDSSLIWNSGQQGPAAINLPNTMGLRMAGSFAMFVPGNQADSAQIFEDGVTLLITNAAWHHVMQSLQSGRNVELPLSGEYSRLSILWS